KESTAEIPLSPNFTKIKIPGKVARGAKLSPDGKILTYSSEMYEGSLWKIPVPGNVAPDVAGKPEKLIGNGNVWAWGHTWSADGKWIAYNHYSKDSEKRKFTVDQVHVIPSSGGNPKKIKVPLNRGGNFHLFQYTLSLSPDGKTLAYSSSIKNPEVNRPNECHIYIVPVNGGNPNQISEHDAWLPAFSPDGKKIAYIRKAGENDELWTVSEKGNYKKKVCDLDGRAGGPLIWSPDSKWITLLNSSEENGTKIWLIPLREDDKLSNPIKDIELPAEPSLNLAGWIENNKMGTLLLSPEKITIYTIPSSGGKATQISAKGGLPQWTSDENKIFIKDKKVYSADTRKGELSEIPGTELDVTGNSFNVSPDGKKLVLFGTKKGGDGLHIFTIPADGGKLKQVTDSPLYDAFPRWSPDGKYISFKRQERTPDGKNIVTRVCLVSAEGGDVKNLVPELKDLNAGSDFFWTSDSKALMYYCRDDGKIKTVPVNGGNSKVPGELKKGMNPGWIAISPDGKEILYRDDKKFWSQPVSGGAPQEIKTGLDKFILPVSPDLSPDGKKIIFSTLEGGEIDLWFMEDFLPLDKLAQKSTESKDFPKKTTLQKVISGETTIMWGAVSPNGKFMTYSDPVTFNLAIRELSTGETKILTNDGSENPLQFNMGSVVSPDNKKIAYAWYKNNHEIRLVDINNPQPKTLYANKDEDVWPCAWSSDGKTIYARSILNKECRLLAVDAKSGDIQVIKTFDHIFWLQLDVSPDNKFIAYNFPKYKNGKFSNTDIHVISTKGENESILIDHPANDRILGWVPDKNQILFKSDRSGTWDAWSVKVVNVKVAGEPEKVLTEIGENASKMGFTKNGTFYYSLMVRKFNGSILPLDQTNGKLKMESAKPLLGSIGVAKWSPDGKSIAFIKEKWAMDQRPIYVYDAETGNERLLTDDFYMRDLNWLADNKTLLILGNDERRESEKNYSGGMYTINVQTSEITEVLAFSDYRGKEWKIGLKVAQMLAQGNPGQKNIYYLKEGQLICRELASGQEKILLKDNNFNSNNYTLDPMPGGKNLLFCNENQLFIIPVDEPKLIPIVKRVTMNTITVENNAVWSPDGSYILYAHNTDDGSALWKISAEGKNPKEVWKSKFPICSLSFHPDGKKIAITTISQGAEIWKAENFLPKE
ncbi:MAG: hypothetical protein R6U03_04965, partial [Gillisia sp.]